MSTLTPFDPLWNYADPAATEAKFKEILNKKNTLSDMSYHLQLLTQIARTYSLRGMFSEAHAMLDEVKEALPDEPRLENVRYHLERGRTYNSSGEKENARKEFEKALTISDIVNNDFYTIDTIHMLAIVSEPDEAIEWNLKGLKKAELSSQERAKNWLGSLYNNLGWSYFDKGDHAKALEIFEKSYDWRKEKGEPRSINIAKWSIARTLRAMGSVEEALQMQRELLSDNINPDEYNYEEIIECLKALGRDEEAKTFMAKKEELFKKKS